MVRMFLLFLSLIFSNAAYSDYLLTTKSGKQFCIDTYSILDNSKYIKVVLSRNGKTKYVNVDLSDILPGFEYNSTTDTCDQLQILKDLGLHYHQYHFLMGLLGLLVGVVFLFSVVTIARG